MPLHVIKAMVFFDRLSGESRSIKRDWIDVLLTSSPQLLTQGLASRLPHARNRASGGKAPPQGPRRFSLPDPLAHIGQGSEDDNLQICLAVLPLTSSDPQPCDGAGSRYLIAAYARHRRTLITRVLIRPCGDFESTISQFLIALSDALGDESSQPLQATIKINPNTAGGRRVDVAAVNEYLAEGRAKVSLLECGEALRVRGLRINYLAKELREHQSKLAKVVSEGLEAAYLSRSPASRAQLKQPCRWIVV